MFYKVFPNSHVFEEIRVICHICEDEVNLSSESGECYFVLKQFADYSVDAGVIVSGYPIIVFSNCFHVTKHDVEVFVFVVVILVDLFRLLVELVE